MHPALRLAKAIGILALEQHRDALDARAFARQRVFDLHLPAARLRPALIHPHQHAGPVAGLRAAGAGVDAQNAIVAVVRAIEKNLAVPARRVP